MKQTSQYFVVVFGDPEPDRDPVDSGTYRAEKGYPPFSAKPGDMLILYCTEKYRAYPKRVPGIGIVLDGDRTFVRYRWMPLAEPIPKEVLDTAFESDDRAKMHQLGISTHRVFGISRRSFLGAVAGRTIEWSEV